MSGGERLERRRSLGRERGGRRGRKRRRRGVGGSAAGVGGAGVGGGGGSAAGVGEGPAAARARAARWPIPPGYVPAILGVGYGGIRIVSRDGGKTWGDRAYATTNGGDDQVLLRAVVYGKGLWVATGWKLWSPRTTGIHWVDHGRLTGRPGQGLQHHGGSRLQGRAPSLPPATPKRLPMRRAPSMDGLSLGPSPRTSAIRGATCLLTYRGGKFIAYGDSQHQLPVGRRAGVDSAPGRGAGHLLPGDVHEPERLLKAAWFDGVWLRADWQGKISRSTDGKTFAQAYLDDQKNTLYQSRALAAGYVAPH